MSAAECETVLPFIAEFCNRLRHLREDRGLSVAECIRRGWDGRESSAWYGWESGRHEMHLDGLRVVRRVLGLSDDETIWLVGEE